MPTWWWPSRTVGARHLQMRGGDCQNCRGNQYLQLETVGRARSCEGVCQRADGAEERQTELVPMDIGHLADCEGSTGTLCGWICLEDGASGVPWQGKGHGESQCTPCGVSTLHVPDDEKKEKTSCKDEVVMSFLNSAKGNRRNIERQGKRRETRCAVLGQRGKLTWCCRVLAGGCTNEGGQGIEGQRK